MFLDFDKILRGRKSCLAVSANTSFIGCIFVFLLIPYGNWNGSSSISFQIRCWFRVPLFRSSEIVWAFVNLLSFNVNFLIGFGCSTLSRFETELFASVVGGRLFLLRRLFDNAIISITETSGFEIAGDIIWVCKTYSMKWKHSSKFKSCSLCCFIPALPQRLYKGICSTSTSLWTGASEAKI